MGDVRDDQADYDEFEFLQGHAEWAGLAWNGRPVVRRRSAEVAPGSCVPALRFNPTIRAFYDRLRKAGKPFKVAITACIRKLVVTLNAMVQNSTPWSPSTD